MASMVLINDEKKSPLNLYCKVKNKQRLTDLLNKVIYLFEVEDKREEDFLNPKVKTVFEPKVESVYVFLEPSANNGHEFKSLLNCLNDGDSIGFNRHFESKK